MKPTITMLTDFVATVWTPLFVGVFIAIVVYALWPRNAKKFDAAANIPLRED